MTVEQRLWKVVTAGLCVWVIDRQMVNRLMTESMCVGEVVWVDKNVGRVFDGSYCKDGL